MINVRVTLRIAGILVVAVTLWQVRSAVILTTLLKSGVHRELVMQNQLLSKEYLRFWATRGTQISNYAVDITQSSAGLLKQHLSQHFGHPVAMFAGRIEELRWLDPDETSGSAGLPIDTISAVIAARRTPIAVYGDISVWVAMTKIADKTYSIWFANSARNNVWWGVSYADDQEWETFFDRILNDQKASIILNPAWAIRDMLSMPSPKGRYIGGLMKATIDGKVLFSTWNGTQAADSFVTTYSDKIHVAFYANPSSIQANQDILFHRSMRLAIISTAIASLFLFGCSWVIARREKRTAN